ncbi:MAG: zinc-dependent metalloprotease [Chitinophagaceae bacterium]|nr:zinc-dependent metalloprotease [Chitinophagaceae bacterium]
MKKIFLLLVIGASLASNAQQRPTTPPSTPPGTTPPATGAGPSRPGPKAYKEVITDKAVSKKGLFTVHRVDDKYYFEIPDTLMYREIMAVTRFVRVPANSGSGRATYGGEQTNRQTLAFERGPSNNVFLRVITLINIADSTNQISKAVSNSNLNPIAAAFPIAAFARDSAGVVIDVTEFFKGDNQVVSLSPAGKRSFNLGPVASDRSYIQSINTYPLNTEIRTVKTFVSVPSSGAPTPGGGSSVPAANAAGAVTFELNTSMIVLPRTPMARRYWDRRVGYFPDEFTVYSDDQQRVDQETFAVRWRLEPKDADIERWKRGELVEPKKPIIYYIDPATPKKWVPYLIKGINDWQIAFEAAGFKNAIIGKEWPNDPDMSTEDARFSVLRYFASDVTNAYGPNVHDPRSGEILESHIGWYHNVMKLLHDWYMIQTAAVNPRARKMKFDDDLMGELIRFVSSHEVGHTIGLLHNMGSSSRTPVDSLRNKAWVERYGHTASIMDYARFNYVAQPEDNITEPGLFPKIGDYDVWAIKWGYGYIPGATEEEVKKNSDKLIRETIARNPRTWFGTYELGNDNDPRSQREDLGDNAIKASEYGIKNLQRILNNLQEWTKEPNQINENLNDMYGQLVSQFRRYMGHVTTSVGGVTETFRTAEEGGAIYEVVPRSRQKEAVTFLHKQVFETPKWLVSKDIWNRISNPGEVSDPVTSAQEASLSSLLSNERMNRLQVNVERFGADKAYSAVELLNDVQAGLFSELASKKAIDMYRRGLQKAYVERLNSILNPPAATATSFGGTSSLNLARTDLPAIARAQLNRLRTQVTAAIAGTTDSMSKIHLQDLAERIKDALDPKK